jgi:hypothetical protein
MKHWFGPSSYRTIDAQESPSPYHRRALGLTPLIQTFLLFVNHCLHPSLGLGRFGKPDLFFCNELTDEKECAEEGTGDGAGLSDSLADVQWNYSSPASNHSNDLSNSRVVGQFEF